MLELPKKATLWALTLSLSLVPVGERTPLAYTSCLATTAKGEPEIREFGEKGNGNFFSPHVPLFQGKKESDEGRKDTRRGPLSARRTPLSLS